MKRRSLWLRLRAGAMDSSFILGGLLVILLIVLAVIGPEIAPHNPYVRERIQWIDGELQGAPHHPSATYPLGTDYLGRDNLSLLLHGARNTMLIALVATIGRLLFGLIFGALAGWWPGKWFDRLVTAATEFFASIPGLILAILLVYAIGIRTGHLAFVIAVAVVGWGEVAQIVRSNVLSIRKELYIEAAEAVGLSSIEILSRHALPNLLSTMLALSALQMGSSLLLLGELGFVNIFLGAGTILAGDAGTASQLIFEIPDWGAMLGSTWRSFRALPWLPGVPAAAFFISILSFNLFGQGLQRFSEKGRFYPSGWSVMRFLAIGAVILFGIQYALASTGPEAGYKEAAGKFDVTRAWKDISYLTSPELEGRQTGTEGALLAAGYIAEGFKQSGLTPFGYGGYFQTFSARHGQVTAIPTLEILDQQGKAVYTATEGIFYDPSEPFLSEGVYENVLEIYGSSNSRRTPRRFLGLAFVIHPLEDGIDRSSLFRDWFPGAVRIVPDAALPSSIAAPLFQGPLDFLEANPVVLIGESTAQEILAITGYELNTLYETIEKEGEVEIDTDYRLRLTFGLNYELTPQVNVVGYIPGSDIRVQTNRVLVVAPYSGSGSPATALSPGADENASGVAIMLEVLRQWAEQDYIPERTVAFAAFDESGGLNFLDNPILPTGGNETWTTVILYGLGAGDERIARVAVAGAPEKMFDDSARRMGSKTSDLGYWPFFFGGISGGSWTLPANNSYSGIAITRPGSQLSGTALDTRQNLDPALLEEAGKAVLHFLMVLSSKGG